MERGRRQRGRQQHRQDSAGRHGPDAAAAAAAGGPQEGARAHPAPSCRLAGGARAGRRRCPCSRGGPRCTRAGAEGRRCGDGRARAQRGAGERGRWEGALASAAAQGSPGGSCPAAAAARELLSSSGGFRRGARAAAHREGSASSASPTLQGRGGTQEWTAAVKGLVLMSFSISSTCRAHEERYGAGVMAFRAPNLRAKRHAGDHQQQGCRAAPSTGTAQARARCIRPHTRLGLRLLVSDGAQGAHVVAGGVHAVRLPGIYRHHNALVRQRRRLRSCSDSLGRGWLAGGRQDGLCVGVLPPRAAGTRRQGGQQGVQQAAGGWCSAGGCEEAPQTCRKPGCHH